MKKIISGVRKGDSGAVPLLVIDTTKRVSSPVKQDLDVLKKEITQFILSNDFNELCFVIDELSDDGNKLRKIYSSVYSKRGIGVNNVADLVNDDLFLIDLDTPCSLVKNGDEFDFQVQVFETMINKQSLDQLKKVFKLSRSKDIGVKTKDSGANLLYQKNGFDHVETKEEHDESQRKIKRFKDI